jgi:hypothetical protein
MFGFRNIIRLGLNHTTGTFLCTYVWRFSVKDVNYHINYTQLSSALFVEVFHAC